MEDFDCDVLVIGSGAAGSALSWRLSHNSNLKIICVEQGDFPNPNDYPTNYIDWEVKKESFFSTDPKARHNLGEFVVDDSNSPIKMSYYSGVGGSTVLYSGHFPRLHPSDFRVKSLDGIADDWPISYKDLEPYYQLNDKNIGVAGLVGDPAYPEISELLPPIPLGTMGEIVATAFNNLGWHWWPSYSAINTVDSKFGSKCINLGPCNSGCTQGAKSSSDQRYWPKNLQKGVRLITNTRVMKLEMNHKDFVVGAICKNREGETSTIRSKIFVVAGNGIWTPHLLLNSACERFPQGLANRSGLLGRNLMIHPLAYVEGRYSSDIESSTGPQGCCILSQEFYETDLLRGYFRGFTMQVLRSPGPLESMKRSLSRRQASFGSSFHDDFIRTFNRTIGISMISEDLPEFNNSVSLSSNLDSFGSKVPSVRYSIGENTKKILTHSTKIGTKLLSESGATDILRFAPVSHAGWHLLGTARMGMNSGDSVTNAYGQTHDIPNLFIADGSLFVTSGSVNPASTIQALSIYIADQIIYKFAKISESWNVSSL
jgi:choline dehydrogenase-like flavoprotein